RASTAKIPRLATLARNDKGVVVHTADSLRSLGMTMEHTALSFIRPTLTMVHTALTSSYDRLAALAPSDRRRSMTSTGTNHTPAHQRRHKPTPLSL
ncbi:hypothetical protein, partial [Bifidobacterium aquikefiri]|uniref:hypothetical protein n=1 Tax=Bifidobacterium aquikefiri TaxID=1653207 RepID=UPI0039EA5EA7